MLVVLPALFRVARKNVNLEIELLRLSRGFYRLLVLRGGSVAAAGDAFCPAGSTLDPVAVVQRHFLWLGTMVLFVAAAGFHNDRLLVCTGHLRINIDDKATMLFDVESGFKSRAVTVFQVCNRSSRHCA